MPFFVDGIHDDILTQLSKISALRVISRTSVEQFRGTKLPMKAIAEQLGVTRILEGDVQRAGERVRINVQLIDAANDAHLWAETYDRELTATNIFSMQSEISESIASALRAKSAITPIAPTLKGDSGGGARLLHTAACRSSVPRLLLPTTWMPPERACQERESPGQPGRYRV